MRQSRTFLVLSLIAVLAVGVVAAGGAESVGRGLFKLVGLVGQIVALVRSSYVEEVPIERLEMGAMGGLVNAADPGGAWVPEEHAAEFAAAAAREVPAFGIVLGQHASYPFVVAVVPSSPAATAGLRPGEYLERIGEQAVRARPLWLSVVLLHRAEKAGESVSIDVIDRFVEAKRQITLAPGAAGSFEPRVEVGGDVPVVRLPVVAETAAARLAELLRGQPPGPLVVDLRGSGLGSAGGAVAVAAAIAGGEIEAPRAERSGPSKALKASGAARDAAIFVCIDATTVGPAEVLAAALKRRGAVLVGGESYGDTGERRATPVAGGHLWLAASWFLGPDDKPILGAGIKPDEPVRMRKEGDSVLDRALELARDKTLRKAA